MNHVNIPDKILEFITPGKVLSIISPKAIDIINPYDSIINYLTNEKEVDFAQTISREVYLFGQLSIFDNIYIHETMLYGKRKQKLLSQFGELLDRFHLSYNPMQLVSSISLEDQKIIEMIRAYNAHPKLIVLNDTMAFLGYYYSNIFINILRAFQNDGTRIIYFSTKWEEALRVGNYFAVVNNGVILNDIFSYEEVKVNPRKIVYLLSGMDELEQPDRGSDDSFDVLNRIFKSSELFIKNYELDGTMKYLIQSIKTVLQADCCTLYLKDRYDKIYNFSDSNILCEKFLLTDLFIDSFINSSEDLLYLTKSTAKTKQCFVNTSNIIPNTTICIPIVSRPKRIGVLQVCYEKYYVCSKKQLLILNTFCNEVSILLETSRLINQSLLLQESHHRIKNNLQIIIGLLYNQKAYSKNHAEVDISFVIDSIVGRIKSISAVHDLLSKNSYGSNIIQINKIIDEILYLFREQGIEFKKEVDDTSIVYNKGTAFAMILNELITNSFRHAFEGQETKSITIKCKSSNDEFLLTVSDDGIGLPKGFDFEKTDSVGMSIIRNLVCDLHGSIKFHNNNGTCAIITIPKKYIICGFIM